MKAVAVVPATAASIAPQRRPRRSRAAPKPTLNAAPAATAP